MISFRIIIYKSNGVRIKILQAPVVQKMDSAIHRINHYPAVKYLGNQLRYSLDKDLSIR